MVGKNIKTLEKEFLINVENKMKASEIQLSNEGKHYESKWVDFIPVIGFIPHCKRVQRYMKGIREGEYFFPENAVGESLKRFSITAYHGITEGIL